MGRAHLTEVGRLLPAVGTDSLAVSFLAWQVRGGIGKVGAHSGAGTQLGSWKRQESGDASCGAPLLCTVGCTMSKGLRRPSWRQWAGCSMNS